MRTAAALFATLVSAPAFAGGLGIVLNGGTHQEDLYYYSSHDTSGEEAVEYDDPNLYPQFVYTQNQLHTGAGLEFVLGDRDERIQGIFRMQWHADAAQPDPATVSSLNEEYIVTDFRSTTRHTGIATAGLNVGVLGNPQNFLAGFAAHAGSGFLTRDHTEFFLLNVGPTVSYKFTRQMIAFADVHYHMRYRKGFSHGANAAVGVRYMFD